MINRLLTTLLLLFSLVAVNAACLGMGVPGEVISEKHDPIVPEEEETESVNESEFEKLRLCDLYARTDNEACLGYAWSQLTLAAICVPGSLTQRVVFARGPPRS